MLKDRETYEIMTPESVGWEESKLVLGKHSGRAGFNAKLKKRSRIRGRPRYPAKPLRAVHQPDRPQEDGQRCQYTAIVEDNLQRVTGDAIVKLVDWRASSASDGSCEAAVMLEINGREREATGRGNGQVDALYTAVDALVDIQPRLEHLHVEAVTSSADAQGSVLTRVRVGDEVYTGHAVSTDIISASLDSYIQAINRALADRASRAEESKASKREAV
ncbi:MAG: alpha-isopropylmalate synthase regulatory domain-containing protein [Thermomicrobiales bacterium]